MLERLEIHNYVLIPRLVIDFNEGFTVLTGETGSGKSIILGALSLILGDKNTKGVVRSGEIQADLSAIFSFSEKSEICKFLDDNNIENEDNSVLIKRIIKDNGRSIITINGVLVNRSTLEELSNLLVAVSSQHAHQSLLKEANQRNVLDNYAKNDVVLESYKALYIQYKEKEKELASLIHQKDSEDSELDYIKFCYEEIEKANIKEGEDDELSFDLKKISMSEFLIENTSDVVEILNGSLEEGLNYKLSKAVGYLTKAATKDEDLQDYLVRLESARIEIEDISESLNDYVSSFSFSEAEAEEKSSRLAILQRLKKKYGPTLSDVIEARENFKRRIDNAENIDDLIKEAEKDLNKIKDQTLAKAIELSNKRKIAAENLQKDVESKLHKLGMKNGRFLIEIKETDLTQNGIDSITFMISANKGEKLGLVKDVASGGELSRIMLALKSSLADCDEVDTLLFDEIDAGLGGETAKAVSDELLSLSASHQVITITHLAQIASVANYHLEVVKTETQERTITTILPIDGEDRVKEIARLLSGSTSQEAIAHAKSLLH